MQQAVAFFLGITYNIGVKKHIQDKRDELIWALSLQEYTHSEIGTIFKLNRSTILRIIEAKPKDYQPKWKKI
jgi:hypothetical protein